MYDANKPIRLVGKLTKIEWTNPHSFFYIDVTDAQGRVNSWTVEGAGPGALSRRGFNRGDIDLGDTLIVQGYLAKSGARIVDGRLVTLPDGRIINGGSAGDGGPGSTFHSAGWSRPRQLVATGSCDVGGDFGMRFCVLKST